MKKLIILFVWSLVAGAGIAQTKKHILKGQVTDVNGNPIEKAKVSDIVTADSARTDESGIFTLYSAKEIKSIEVEKNGFVDTRASAIGLTFLKIQMQPERKIDELELPDRTGCVIPELEEDLAIYETQEVMVMDAVNFKSARSKTTPMGATMAWNAPNQNVNTESYSEIAENDFHIASNEPLSTFSIDVDRAAYSNVRRFINNGQLPPADAVRVEEMINYFDYDYETPKGKDPVRIFTEVSKAPWNSEHQLLHIGIKAKDMDIENLPASNIVFLIDVSGSMSAANKLPLLKSSMKMLVQQMRKEDKVAIVVYAGAAGLVLEATSGAEKQKIYNAIDNLNAGGSTAGGAGIKLAYQVAVDNLVKDGNNRIVLATDGDFNVGDSSDNDMETLIESKRNQGVFLTVLGVGMGNYKDSKMEILADKGNGNYAYIDNITEAKKTLVNEFGGTMFAVAKDVKIQVEFNPANVAEYRLIGYENRLLNKEDFNNDKKDAGEMGVGHVVTALYEIVPFGKSSNRVDPLKYQRQNQLEELLTDELVTVKLRYKEPDGEKSQLMTHVVEKSETPIDKASTNLKWSASVAGFGMLLRDSEKVGELNYASNIKLAETAIGKDKEGYRRECLQLMKSAELLDKSSTAQR